MVPNMFPIPCILVWVVKFDSSPLECIIMVVASIRASRKNPIFSAWCFSFLSTAIMPMDMNISIAISIPWVCMPCSIPPGFIAVPLLHPYCG